MVLNKYLRYQETEEEFMDRTFWNDETKRVLVFHSDKAKKDIDVAPKQIISFDEAKEYLESLKELNYSH